jgi:hypothetical protein
MDLRNNQITVGELLENPAAKKLLEKEFPEITNPMMLGFARPMTIAKVLEFSRGQYPQDKIDKILAALRAI